MATTFHGNDYSRQVKKVLVASPQSITGAIDLNEIALTDQDKCIQLSFIVGALVGVDASNYFTFNVKQGTETGGPYTDVDADQLDPLSSWDLKVDAAGEADGIYRINFIINVDQGFLVPYIGIIGTPTSMELAADADWASMDPPEG